MVYMPPGLHNEAPKLCRPMTPMGLCPGSPRVPAWFPLELRTAHLPLAVLVLINEVNSFIHSVPVTSAYNSRHHEFLAAGERRRTSELGVQY